MNIDHCIYRATWSAEDAERVGLCAEFTARIPPPQHRRLAIEASEQGVSLDRLVSAKRAV